MNGKQVNAIAPGGRSLVLMVMASLLDIEAGGIVLNCHEAIQYIFVFPDATWDRVGDLDQSCSFEPLWC